MRSPNYRLLAVLAVLAAVVSGGAYWLHGLQLRRNARLFLANAEEALRREQFAEAASCLAWRLRLAPHDLESYPRLAALLRGRLDRPEEGDLWMDRLVAVNPVSPRAHVLRAEFWQRAGRLKEAAAAATEALRFAPDDADALVLLTECALAGGDFEQARRQALRLLEVAPESDSSYATLARIEIHSGRRDDAIEWLRQGTAAAEKPSELAAMLVDLLIDEGEIDEAQNVVQGLAGDQGGGPFASYVEARIEYAEGRWSRAADAFEVVRPKLAGRPELLRNVDLWLGDCYGRLGRIDRQMTAYRRALTVDSTWAPARAGLAEALLSAGRAEEALREYRALVQLPAAPPSGWCDLAHLLIARNRRLPRADRDWTEIDAALERAAAAAADWPRVAVLRAEALVLQERSAAAEKLLQEALDKNPGEIDLWTASAALARRQGDHRRAEKLLEEARGGG